ncbi:N-acetylmuramic acid 6-phosphate etherase [Brachybacterium sp. NPDC056505]|uniref:N-acetylmuramic acid 6-phosphate etherase n=1 Tax=Brachybacterium sp. NPDC056505 TaxID=3345843 RepID=UPI00366BF51F
MTEQTEPDAPTEPAAHAEPAVRAEPAERWQDLIALASPTEERNPRTHELDTLDAPELVDTILAEDARVAGAVQAVSAPIARLVDLCVEAVAAGSTVHYVGAGTSGRLGVLDAVELLPTYSATEQMVTAHLAGGIAAMTRAVEGAEDDADAGAALVADQCGEGDVVIGLAASGRTPFVRGSLAAARERGLSTGLVAANPQAPLARLADVAVLVDVGPEAVTGSTRMKAATAQKLVLNALSTATMVRLGTTFQNLMIDVRPTNAKLVARTVRMLVQATGESPERAAEVLEEAGGRVRVALVALLAHADVTDAEVAAVRFGKDPGRRGDPAGIRSAVASLTTKESP